MTSKWLGLQLAVQQIPCLTLMQLSLTLLTLEVTVPPPLSNMQGQVPLYCYASQGLFEDIVDLLKVDGIDVNGGLGTTFGTTLHGMWPPHL